MLRLPLLVQSGRVGRQKRKGIIVHLVLDQMEEHPADEMNGGAIAMNERLDRAFIPFDLLTELSLEPLPKVLQQRPAQIFGAGHQRRAGERVVEFFRGDCHMRLMPQGFEIGSVAELFSKDSAETSPIVERWRKRNCRVAKTQEEEGTVRMRREPTVNFLLEQVLAPDDPLLRRLPLQPDRAVRHDDRLQFLIQFRITDEWSCSMFVLYTGCAVISRGVCDSLSRIQTVRTRGRGRLLSGVSSSPSTL